MTLALLVALFLRENPPTETFSARASMPPDAPAQLVEPRALLPRAFDYPYGELSALVAYAKDCRRPRPRPSASLSKAWIWQRHVCGELALPGGFFAKAPYVHPLGRTYAARARERGEGTPESDRYLHLAERPGPQQGLAPGELEALLRESEVVLAGERAFVRLEPGEKQVSPVPASARYGVYPRRKWVDFARSQEPGSGAARLAIGAAIAISAIVAALGAFGALRRARARKRDEERRAFMLRMLTHELRTPATGLRLSLEELRAEFDRLPEASQKAFLRLCDDLQRLQRITDASQSYLRASELSGEGRGLLVLKPVRIESLNAFLESVAEPYRERIAFRGLERDGAFELDPYWVELCIRNLVENALAHGAAPVELRASVEGDGLVLAVSDGGRFSDASRSPGLGLGLSIVRTVVEAMGGELGERREPTVFAIRLRGAPA